MTKFFGQSVLLDYAIGRGPSTPDKFGAVVMLGLGALLVVMALSRGTRLRGAFSYGKGPSVPIGSAGRVTLLILALVMFAEASRALLH